MKLFRLSSPVDLYCFVVMKRKEIKDRYSLRVFQITLIFRNYFHRSFLALSSHEEVPIERVIESA